MKQLLTVIILSGYFLCSCSNGRDYSLGKSESKNSETTNIISENRTDLCNLKQKEILSAIGETFKIYHTGGVYSTINESDQYAWPSETIKSKSGLNGWGSYVPKAGDIGELIHVFESKSKHRPYILLLNINDLYVPVSCGYVVRENEMDINEESDAQWTLDSLNNIAYANGCMFKSDARNGGCWARQNLAEIDRESEDFACSLINNGIDTVLLSKYLSGNGTSRLEHACIFWIKDGQYYFKRIDVDENKRIIPSSQSKINNSKIFSYFFENEIDTVSTDPTPKIYISHEHGYLVQLFTPQNFFCQKLTRTYIEGDPTHVKSVWWDLMISEIKENSTN